MNTNIFFLFLVFWIASVYCQSCNEENIWQIQKDNTTFLQINAETNEIQANGNFYVKRTFPSNEIIQKGAAVSLNSDGTVSKGFGVTVVAKGKFSVVIEYVASLNDTTFVVGKQNENPSLYDVAIWKIFPNGSLINSSWTSMDISHSSMLYFSPLTDQSLVIFVENSSSIVARLVSVDLNTDSFTFGNWNYITRGPFNQSFKSIGINATRFIICSGVALIPVDAISGNLIVRPQYNFTSAIMTCAADGKNVLIAGVPGVLEAQIALLDVSVSPPLLLSMSSTDYEGGVLIDLVFVNPSFALLTAVPTTNYVPYITININNSTPQPNPTQYFFVSYWTYMAGKLYKGFPNKIILTAYGCSIRFLEVHGTQFEVKEEVFGLQYLCQQENSVNNLYSAVSFSPFQGSSRGIAVYASGFSILDWSRGNVLGVALANTSQNSVEVALTGVISGVFSGLEVGATYYAHPSGEILPFESIYLRKSIGVALSSTELLLRGI